jgi:outer membrane protein OmpA-like peptidoglycan-associated protein
MRTLRIASVTTSAVLLLALGAVPALTGCTAEAKATGSFEAGTPPPPPPAATPPDDDGDGILNADDKCPNEKEDGQPPNDKDGCPNLDPDGDGIVGAADKCPNEPETKNDFEDDDGCPDKKPLVQLVGQEVRINQKIQFKKGSAAIEEESKPILDAVADVLKKNPDIQLVEVGGHASKEGDAAFNKGLTQKRVESVSKELVTRGVEKERLYSQGYGFYCPLDPGETPEALEKNRRVEFKILFRAGKATDMARGCEAAEKANIKPKPLPKTPWQAKTDATKSEPAKKEPAKTEPAKTETKPAGKALSAPKK